MRKYVQLIDFFINTKFSSKPLMAIKNLWCTRRHSTIWVHTGLHGFARHFFWILILTLIRSPSVYFPSLSTLFILYLTRTLFFIPFTYSSLFISFHLMSFNWLYYYVSFQFPPFQLFTADFHNSSIHERMIEIETLLYLSYLSALLCKLFR